MFLEIVLRSDKFLFRDASRKDLVGSSGKKFCTVGGFQKFRVSVFVGLGGEV
jgi:hypothetical protein